MQQLFSHFLEPGKAPVTGRLLLFLLLFSLLSGAAACTPFAPAVRLGHEEAPLPESFSMTEPLADPGQRWWESFGDKQLNSFIDEALGGNQTLASYWARLEKAQAQARKAGSDLWPAVGADANASYSKIRTDSGGTPATVENDKYSIGFGAGYEIDLWGRIRAGRESAELDAEASREDLNAAALSLAAEVTGRWLAILSKKLQRKLLEQQLAVNTTYLELVDLRFRNSLASALDVLQQRQLLEKIKAQMPIIDLQERVQKNQLAVLLGRMVHDLPEIKGQELPVLEAVPAAGLPADLLQNRPDIAAAFKRLAAADQDLAAARADRLPALNLSGGSSYDSSELDLLFENWIINLGAALAVPVIDGGRRRAEVDVNRAAVRQSLADYRQLVLTAVREVEDALIRESRTREHIGALENQLEAARRALSEAQSRYVNGLNDYLPVLTQLLSVQGLESDLVQRQEDLLAARIGLYRAIGGSWTVSLAPPDGTNLTIRMQYNDNAGK